MEDEEEVPHDALYDSPFDFTKGYSQTTEFGSAFKYRDPEQVAASGFPTSRYAANWVLGKRFRSEHLLREHNGYLHRSILETAVIIVCYALLVMTLPFSLFFCLRFVAQFERLVVFRLGRLQAAKGPGTVLLLPCIDTWKPVDLRTKAFNVPPLQIVTADKGLIELGATVYYRIKDALAAINSVQDWNQATRTLAHTTMQRKLNKKQASDVEKHRRDIASDLVDELNSATFTWGMEITEVQFSDLKIIKEPENNAENVIKALSNPEVAGRLFAQFAGQVNAAGGPTVPQAVTIDGDNIATVDMKMPGSAPSQTNSVAIEMEPMTSRELTNLVYTIRSILSPELAAEVGSSYQVTVPGHGSFFLDLTSAPGRCEMGSLPEAEVSIALTHVDLEAMLIGQLSPFDAYLSGKVTIQGNPRTAIKLEALAKHVKAKYGSGEA